MKQADFDPKRVWQLPKSQMKSTELEFEVAPIFPELIYSAKIEITEKLKKYLMGIEMKERYPYNFGSVNTYLLQENNSEIINIRTQIEKHLVNFIEKIYGDKFPESTNPYFTQSWINIIKPKGMHYPHDHVNSFISGILYIQTVENDGVQFNDRGGFGASQSTDNFRFQTFPRPDMRFPVTPGQLLLFKSTLQHGVQPNEHQSKDRMSLAFNTFVEGVIGDQQDLTEIVLNKHEKYK